MLMSSPVAPSMVTSSSSGRGDGRLHGLDARGSRPAARPVPISARPCSAMMVRTSAKSTLTRPWHGDEVGDALHGVEQHLVGLLEGVDQRHVLAGQREQPLVGDDDERVDRRLELRRCPASACLRRRLPSKRKGLVTTPTVSAPSSLAISATTGAAPVPVPPPMPAVTKTMSAPVERLGDASSRPRAPPCGRPRGWRRRPGPCDALAELELDVAPCWRPAPARRCWRR